MRFDSSARFLVLFSLVLAFSVRGDWTKLSASEFELSAPPEPETAAYERDFRELHRWQRSRDEKQCELAANQLHPTFDALFGTPGAALSEGEYEEVEPLMNRVFRVSLRISGYFKNQYQRPRPYSVDKSLRPCIQRPGGSKAYPSSHAAVGAVGACLLAKKYPGKAVRLREDGNYVGELRAIAGVHHPSDIEAGQSLGRQICEKLLADDEFTQELLGR